MFKKIPKISLIIIALLIWAIFLAPSFDMLNADLLLDDVVGDKLPKAPDGPDGEEQSGVEQLQWLADNAVYLVKWLMVAVSIGYLTFYGFMYITSQGKDEAISEQHDNLIWAVFGFAVIGLSNLAVDIFQPQATGEAIDTEVVNEGLMSVVVFIEYMLGAIAVLYMLLGAIRFIMAGGDESVMETEKRNFTWGFLGLIIVMIADTFINLVYNKESEEFAWKQGTEDTVNEIFGVVNFILAFMAVIGVLTIVIAGIYYVTAIGDEESTKKAQRIITTTIIGFIIMSLAYVVVSTFAR